MLDHIATTQQSFARTGLVDDSARPDAPVVATRDRARLDTRVRAHLAARLHRVAAALEPRPRRHRPTPACQ